MVAIRNKKMNITLIMVATVNGKITHGFDPDVTQWTSKEDQELFATIKKQHRLIVMGSHTYEKNLQRIHATEGILRVILTKNPSAFSKNTIPGQLEFSDETPTQLVGRLEKKGFTSMLLAGGAEINSAFLKENLVDEVSLTIEPKLFGTGKNLMADCDISLDMKLTHIKQLNETGTLHLLYTILK